MNINMETQVGALFKLVVHKGDGVPVRESEWFHNIVLDTGLARMSVGAWAGRCCVGTGNSTPVASQTALDAFKASTTTQQAATFVKNTSSSPFYYGSQVTWRFGEGVAAGNITEVGLGWANDQLWNRALVKDAQGNPTAITVLSDEFLDIVSEIRVYPQASYTGTLNLLDKSGATVSTHTITGRPLLYASGSALNMAQIYCYAISIFSGDMGSTVNQSPSNAVGVIMGVTNTYPTATSMQSAIALGLNDSVGSHRSFLYTIQGIFNNNTLDLGYQFQIDPPINKTNSQAMTYTFTMNWGRYTP